MRERERESARARGKLRERESERVKCQHWGFDKTHLHEPTSIISPTALTRRSQKEEEVTNEQIARKPIPKTHINLISYILSIL